MDSPKHSRQKLSQQEIPRPISPTWLDLIRPIPTFPLSYWLGSLSPQSLRKKKTHSHSKLENSRAFHYFPTDIDISPPHKWGFSLVCFLPISFIVRIESPSKACGIYTNVRVDHSLWVPHIRPDQIDPFLHIVKDF